MAFERNPNPTAGANNPTRDDDTLPSAQAVKLIAGLAKYASGYSFVEIATDELDDAGLPEKVPALFNKATGRLESVRERLEEFRTRPARRKGEAKAETLESFVDLVNRHKSEHSVIFGCTDLAKLSLTAVLDYHEKDHGDPAFGQHRVGYAFPQTEEFRAWIAHNGKPFDQGEFAAFLEEHAAELAEATTEERQFFEELFREKFASPSDLITLSRGLEVNVGAKVKQGVRLASGERTVLFETEHTNAKGEPVEVPGIFMVSVPAWLGGEPLRVPARLRYRIRAGAIEWFFQLYRVEFWVRERVVADMKRAGDEAGLPAFLARPEM